MIYLKDGAVWEFVQETINLLDFIKEMRLKYLQHKDLQIFNGKIYGELKKKN